jgi:hypothetical protein
MWGRTAQDAPGLSPRSTNRSIAACHRPVRESRGRTRRTVRLNDLPLAHHRCVSSLDDAIESPARQRDKLAVFQQNRPGSDVWSYGWYVAGERIRRRLGRLFLIARKYFIPMCRHIGHCRDDGKHSTRKDATLRTGARRYREGCSRPRVAGRTLMGGRVLMQSTKSRWGPSRWHSPSSPA